MVTSATAGLSFAQATPGLPMPRPRQSNHGPSDQGQSSPFAASHPVAAVLQRRAMDPDAALIARAQNGDPAAFRQLFLQHRDTVSRVVFRMIGPHPDVEDVVQDVFLNVYRSLPSFRRESKFSTWLYRLATNVTRMHLRRGRSRPRFADVEVPEAPPDNAPQDTPDLHIERAQRVRALYRILDDLSEKKREVLVLHDLEGVPAKEIAETLEIPVLTVRTRLFYARKELYAALAVEPSLAAVMTQLMDDLPGKPTRGGEDRGPDGSS